MIRSRVKNLLALAGFLFFLNTTVQAQTINDAKKQIEAENWNKARKTLAALTAKDAKDARPHYYMGLLLLQTSTLDSAETAFNTGIATNPKEALNYVGLAKVKFARNKPVEADNNIQKALELTKKKDANVLLGAAEAYLNAPGKLADKAIPLLDEAIKIQPTNAELYLQLGEAYFIKNVGGQAVTNYERALRNDPKLAQAHMKIGKIYAQARNFAEAEKALQKAIAIDTTFAPAYREIGELYYQASQLDKARQAYKTYVRLANNDIQARGRYAGFLYLSKDYAGAIAYANEVLSKDPKNYIMLRVKGYSQYETADYANALKTLETYFATVPADKVLASDYENYGNIQAKLNKTKEALVSLNKALQLDSTQSSVHTSMAELYNKQKDYKNAAREYRLRIKSNQAITLLDYYSLGQALYQDKQFTAADSAFKVIVEKQPNLPLGYQWRARSQASLDPESTKGLARENYELMIEKALTDPVKNKKVLIEGYEYMGYYWYLKGDKAKAKSYFLKIKELDPTNAKATESLKSL